MNTTFLKTLPQHSGPYNSQQRNDLLLVYIMFYLQSLAIRVNRACQNLHAS